MPSSQGYRKVASEPVDPEPEVPSPSTNDTTMPSQQQQKSGAEPQTVVTGNPAGKIPATNSQQRLMPADSDSVSSTVGEADQETPPHGGGGGGGTGGGIVGGPWGTDDEQSFTDSFTPRVSRRKAWFTVIVLCFVNLINYMDRFTIAGKNHCLWNKPLCSKSSSHPSKLNFKVTVKVCNSNVHLPAPPLQPNKQHRTI